MHTNAFSGLDVHEINTLGLDLSPVDIGLVRRDVDTIDGRALGDRACMDDRECQSKECKEFHL